MNFKKKIIPGALIALLISAGTAVAAPDLTASAASSPFTSVGATLSKEAACSGLNQVDGGAQPDCSTLDRGSAGIERIISAVVTILSYIVGIVAVIMIIVAGFKFIAAGGDSGRVSSAKSTLIYALVGLAVAALAQFLVTFVLSNT